MESWPIELLLPVEKKVEDLIFALNQIRNDYLVTGNEVGGIVLLDPESKEYVGFVNVRTTEVTFIDGREHG